MSRSVDEAIAAMLDRYGVSRGAAEALRILLELLADPRAPTSVHDPQRAVDVHIADALAALVITELRTAGCIADIGAGAGLPGLALAAALPRTRFALVEASSRKCDFLRSAVAGMGVENVAVVWARVEEWRDGIGRCDVVCARALAALPVLCEYAAPLLREGGLMVAWKGAVSEIESADGQAAAAHLGLRADPVRPVVPFAGSDRRTLHLYRKVGPTPPAYPRRAGAAVKRPLSTRDR